MSNSKPIGVFDSGFGGLTVLKNLIEELPEESYLYLGDSARLPYGTKSPGTIKKYLKQNINFLQKLDVKSIVIACHSASTVLDLPTPSNSPDKFSIYNMITAGVTEALQVSQTGRIGVIGTTATVQGLVYQEAIKKLNPLAEVTQIACPLFVPLVEEGLDQDPLTNLISYRYLSPFKNANIDTLIMGCTHYPVLKNSIQKVLGSEVQLIDPATPLSKNIKQDILNGNLEKGASDTPTLKILASDTSPSFLKVAQKIINPIKLDSIELVDIN